jgi:hemoglobin
MQRTRQHLVDLLCTATGGPCYYPGRDMKSVHAQFEITGDVWNAFTGHFNETFARFNVGERERNELVAIVQSLRGDIVNRP